MSLCDKDAITRSDLGALYRLRWNIETFYKLEKGVYLGQGQFHSESVDGVMQEIYALALFVAITRYTMASAARKTGVPYEALSPKSGCLGFGAYVVRLLLASSKAMSPRSSSGCSRALSAPAIRRARDAASPADPSSRLESGVRKGGAEVNGIAPPVRCKRRSHQKTEAN